MTYSLAHDFADVRAAVAAATPAQNEGQTPSAGPEATDGHGRKVGDWINVGDKLRPHP